MHVLGKVRPQGIGGQFGNGKHGPSRSAQTTIVTSSFAIYNMMSGFFVIRPYSTQCRSWSQIAADVRESRMRNRADVMQADNRQACVYVRYWHKADISSCTAHVCFLE